MSVVGLGMDTMFMPERSSKKEVFFADSRPLKVDRVGKGDRESGFEKESSFGDVFEQSITQTKPNETQRQFQNAVSQGTRLNDSVIEGEITSFNQDNLNDDMATQYLNEGSFGTHAFGNQSIEGNEIFNSTSIQSISTPDQGVMKLNTNQKAMLEFMDFMESEFGITPTRIVESMAKMGEEDLSLPAQDTMSEVLDRLGLEPEQKVEAKQQYQTMLDQLYTQSNDSDSVSHSKSEAVTSQVEEKVNQEKLNFYPSRDQRLSSEESENEAQTVALEAQSQPLTRKEKLNQSIDSMNKKFFMKDSFSAQASDAEPLQNQGQIHKFFDHLEMREPNLKYGQDPNVYDSIQRPKEGQLDHFFQTQNETLKPFSQGLEEKQRMGLDGKSVIQEMAQGQNIESDMFQMKSNRFNQMSQPSTSSVDSTSLSGLSQAEFQNQSESQEQAHFDSSQEQNFFASKGDSSEGINRAGKEFTLSSSDVSSENEILGEKNQVAKEQIVERAQFLARKGGGEMKLKLNGEMGQVDLKVNVNKGNVSIQMLTDSVETKKLIENSVHDLKSNLASHRLSLDALRVEATSESGRNQMNMNLSDSEAELNREQARQFLSDFRQGNESFKQAAYFDMPQIRSYGKRIGSELKSIGEVDSSQAREESKNGRLHLVA